MIAVRQIIPTRFIVQKSVADEPARRVAGEPVATQVIVVSAQIVWPFGMNRCLCFAVTKVPKLNLQQDRGGKSQIL